MSARDQTLLARVAARLREAAHGGGPEQEGSVLAASARRYGAWRPGDGAGAAPTFDPEAAALFEAVVEASYLVANADGVFDDTERAAFHEVVLTACRGAIPARQLTALMEDLAVQLREDGIDKRVRMVARIIASPEQAREVLRVAALIAHVSEGVSAVEREVMLKLAHALGLGNEQLDEALQEVEQQLSR
jgi:tellurite resistance protein